jgi:hypothetical protein
MLVLYAVVLHFGQTTPNNISTSSSGASLLPSISRVFTGGEDSRVCSWAQSDRRNFTHNGAKSNSSVSSTQKHSSSNSLKSSSKKSTKNIHNNPMH